MNGFHVFIFAFIIVGAVVLIPRAIRLDRADAYHLMHGPHSGCVECEGK